MASKISTSKKSPSAAKKIGSAVGSGFGETIQWTNHLYQFISIILLFKFGGALFPEVMNASESVAGIAGLPLGGLFGGGVVVMIVVVIFIASVIKNANKMAK